jgi:hypothetical protein
VVVALLFWPEGAGRWVLSQADTNLFDSACLGYLEFQFLRCKSRVIYFVLLVPVRLIEQQPMTGNTLVAAGLLPHHIRG